MREITARDRAGHGTLNEMREGINGAVKLADMATGAEAAAGADNTKWMSPARTREAMDGYYETLACAIKADYAQHYNKVSFSPDGKKGIAYDGSKLILFNPAAGSFTPLATWTCSTLDYLQVYNDFVIVGADNTVVYILGLTQSSLTLRKTISSGLLINGFPVQNAFYIPQDVSDWMMVAGSAANKQAVVYKINKSSLDCALAATLSDCDILAAALPLGDGSILLNTTYWGYNSTTARLIHVRLDGTSKALQNVTSSGAAVHGQAYDNIKDEIYVVSGGNFITYDAATDNQKANISDTATVSLLAGAGLWWGGGKLHFQAYDVDPVTAKRPNPPMSGAAEFVLDSQGLRPVTPYTNIADFKMGRSWVSISGVSATSLLLGEKVKLGGLMG